MDKMEAKEDEREPWIDIKPVGHEKGPNDTELKNTKKIKFVLFGSIVLGALLLCLNIITFVYMNSESREFGRNTALCINCSYLKLHPDDDLSSFDVYESDSCCLKENGNYSQVVNKLVDRNLKERLLFASRPYQPLHCRKEDQVKPVIKMVGKWINSPDPNATRFHWLKWDVDVHTNGNGEKGLLTHDDTHVTVGSTGIYQIYSQIVLHNKKSEEPSAYSISSYRYYVHAIYKQSRSGHDERILGGSYTYYENKDGESAITSYLGSPYQLMKGEKIGVKVHDLSQVVASNVTNFFGMHLIE